MSTGTLTSFWHVDGHTDVVLACRRAHLHRFGMSTGTICYVDGHIYFTLYYSPFPTYFLATQRVVLACRWAHVRRFGMLTGTFWHVDEHIYYFNLFYTLLCVLSICYFSFPTYFLASWGVVVACRWAHFGMSTDTFITSLHFTILPFQPTFWHRGRPFGMLTGTFTIFPFQPTLASGVGLTFFGFRHRDYIYRNAVRSSLALPHKCYAMRSSLVLGHRHDARLSNGVGWDNVPWFRKGLNPTGPTAMRYSFVLRYEICSCTCTPTWCHAIRPSSGSGLGGVGWGGVCSRRWALGTGTISYRYEIFTCASTHMRRYGIFSCTCTPT